MTRDWYLTILVEVFTNHFSAENTYFTNHTDWTEHKIIGFKPANGYIPDYSAIALIDNFHHPFLCQPKNFCKHFLQS